MSDTRGYHHGDLRRTLLTAAVQAIEESGPAALSLRDLARRAGVSHAAPAHHFGDRAGLFTAIAVQGFDTLAAALAEAGDELLDLGVAYVEFAVRHRAHFEVMFHPDLHRADDAELRAARERSGAVLRAGLAHRSARPEPAADGPQGDVLAAWSIVHGFATLWLAGALPAGLGEDPGAAARSVIRHLFTPAAGTD
ncbi:TetR/AcrR family transcriptional regulator [Micromonospora andamanensis]|uniref:TetR family transcriptional regulator n=1 Tax=Micromonospora andamanensis TaxID=1287068 RepID=A0ABQ4HT72_9ACTN|nr:TetR/AcrR family transcriptional regulator [Micromonospora andamanensis]GIJ08810.1 TetR family transcriptional regulator [Micromonospora andamanensis]GIJ40735.1 TetR family transcriptional regulator [Micromonospora andamanensis]